MKSLVFMVVALSIAAMILEGNSDNKVCKLEETLKRMDHRKLQDLGYKMMDKLDAMVIAGKEECDRRGSVQQCNDENISMEAMVKKVPCCKVFMLYENCMYVLEGGSPLRFPTDNLAFFKDLM